MKIAITVKTGKGEKSTEKEIDKTVDTALEIGSILHKKYGLQLWEMHDLF